MRRGALIQAPTVRRHGSFSANSASSVARWLQEVRKSTVVCIFDWGRSELNTMQKCLGCWAEREERWVAIAFGTVGGREPDESQEAI